MAKKRSIVLKFKILLYTISVSALIVLLSACSSINEKDLQGTYVAEYPFGSEKLILNADKEYIQEVFVKGEPKSKPITLKCKGSWSYNPDDKYVALENGLDVADPAGGLNKDYNVPVKGLVLAKVRRTFPSIRLGTAYEDVDFVKIK